MEYINKVCMLNKILIQKNKKNYVINWLIWLVISIMPFFLSIFIQLILNLYQQENVKRGIIYSNLFLIFGLFQIIFTWKGGIYDTLMRFNIGQYVRNELFYEVLTNSKRINSSMVINILEKDIPVIEELLSFEADLVNKIIYFLVATFVLIKIDIKMTLLILFPLILISFLFLQIGDKIKNNFSNAKEKDYRYVDFLEEVIINRENLSYLSDQKSVLKRLRVMLNNRIKSDIYRVTFNSVFENLIILVHNLGIAIILAFSIPLMKKGNMEVGDFILFTDCIIYGISYLAVFQEVLTDFKYVENIIERIEKIFDLDGRGFADKIFLHCERKYQNPGSIIKFENFRLDYFKGESLTFQLNQGEMLLIKGKNGSGKSRFLDAVMGDKIYQGEIFFQKNEYEKDVQKIFCYVPQIPSLFDSSIQDNISLYDENFDEQNVEYLKLVKLYEDDAFMERYWKKENIGKNGECLSSGQRQRLALVRGIQSGSDIMLLDDSLSYVDSDTANHILIELKKMNKTILYASNHKYLQKYADKILDMETNEMVERK